jgi:nucleotide-binding universal stress UspA family protein
MYRKIAVGTDLSETAAVAVEHAAWISSKVGAELVLVHAGSDPGEPLAELAKKYGAETAVASGPPAEVLLQEAERLNADLLVVGSVGMSGAKRFMLGNVPNKVSHHAQQDLMIVKTQKRKGGGEGYKKILAGTDGSPTAMRAVEMAAEFADRLGAALTIACVYEHISEAEEERARRAGSQDAIGQWNAGRSERGTPDEFKWRIASTTHAEDVLDRAETCAAEHNVDPDLRAIEGNAAEELLSLAESEGFDMIAVGSVGMAGPKRFMLGNVPHRISHHSPTDVLILHTA